MTPMTMRYPEPAANRGFATISTALLLSLVLAMGGILYSYAMSSRNAAKRVSADFSAIQFAEAGVQKAVFCLNATSGTNCGGTSGTSYAGESNVAVGEGTFTTVITGSGSSRTITSTGTTPSGSSVTVVVDATTVPPNDDMDFGYALQSGEGGAHLENNASIEGTLYSNGDVDCQTTSAGTNGDIYVAKVGGSIDRCTVGYNAYADSILRSDVTGDAHYDSDVTDTTIGGASYPGSATPTSESLPNIDLDFWHDSAESGGVIFGDYHPTDGETLGPVKIVGDLVMDNNVDIWLGGPVWVVGDITTGNNSTFNLDSSWGENSTTVLADDPGNETVKGRIVISNNTGITGSGDSKSHILFVSTYDSDSDTVPAISVSNNASGAVFLATSGTLRLENGAGAKSLAGHRLFVDQNGTVTYVESDLAGMNFSNSPGGVFRLLSGTWREKKS